MTPLLMEIGWPEATIVIAICAMLAVMSWRDKSDE